MPSGVTGPVESLALARLASSLASEMGAGEFSVMDDIVFFFLPASRIAWGRAGFGMEGREVIDIAGDLGWDLLLL